MEEAATPLPSEETTPPVTNIYFCAIRVARPRPAAPVPDCFDLRRIDVHTIMGMRERSVKSNSLNAQNGIISSSNKYATFAWWVGLIAKDRSACGAGSVRLRTSASGRKPEGAMHTSNLASGLLAGKRVVALGSRTSRKIQIKLGSNMKAISSMRAGLRVSAGVGLLAGTFLFASTASAQRTAASTAAAQTKAIAEGRSHSAYDASREVSLQGTVAKFTENSTDLPVGAHVLVQTPSGQVDV